MLKHKLLLIFSFFIYTNVFSDFYFGPSLAYRKYIEKLPDRLEGQESGLLYGFKSGINTIFAKIVYIDFNVNYLQGITNYHGSLQSLITGDITSCFEKTGNSLFNFDGSLGIPLRYQNITLLPLWGVGRYAWERKLATYTVKYEWLYLQFGGSLSLRVNKAYL